MAHWKDTAVTDDGVEMLNEWMAGRKISITDAYGGTGTVDVEKLAEQHGLVDTKQRLSLMGEENRPDGKTVQVQVSNASVTEEYELNQVGVYAALDIDRDPDAPRRLLFIMQDEKGVIIPSAAEASYMLELYCAIGITNNGRFEVTVDAAGIVTVGHMRESIRAALEAHNTDPDAHGGLRAGLDELVQSIFMGTVYTPMLASSGAELATQDGTALLAQKPVSNNARDDRRRMTCLGL